MLKKIVRFWDSLEGSATVSKRELFLGITACALAGILTGMLLSPKKTVTIGSHNGNNNTGNAASLGSGEEPREETEE